MLLFNHSDDDFQGKSKTGDDCCLRKIRLTRRQHTVKEGDRIAQLVLERVSSSARLVASAKLAG